MDYTDSIAGYIKTEIETLKALDINAINAAMNLLCECNARESDIYIFGNGGSASTASHYANDFNKGLAECALKRFRFICLNDNVATIMAVANDISYEEVFRYQLRGRLKPSDLIIAISGSGNSRNVINAVTYAKEMGCKIIGLTGYNGGKLKPLADISLHAPIDDMQVAEDIHMVFDHLMMSVFIRSH